MAYIILKGYIGTQLIKSKPITSISQLQLCLYQAQCLMAMKRIYCKSNNKQVTYLLTSSPPVHYGYMGSDGIYTQLIPTRLSAYPYTPVCLRTYSNSNTKAI